MYIEILLKQNKGNWPSSQTRGPFKDALSNKIPISTSPTLEQKTKGLNFGLGFSYAAHTYMHVAQTIAHESHIFQAAKGQQLLIEISERACGAGNHKASINLHRDDHLLLFMLSDCCICKLMQLKILHPGSVFALIYAGCRVTRAFSDGKPRECIRGRQRRRRPLPAACIDFGPRRTHAKQWRDTRSYIITGAHTLQLSAQTMVLRAPNDANLFASTATRSVAHT
jgi:hypothetical protein